MPAGYDIEEARRREREQRTRDAGAGGNTREYRGNDDWIVNESYDEAHSGGGGVGGSPYSAAADAYMDPEGYWMNAGTSFLDNLTGKAALDSEARAAAQAERDRAMLLRLAESAPSAEDLTPEYYLEAGRDQFGSLAGGPSALGGMRQADQQRALGSLAELMGGGLTQADRDALNAQRLQQGQMLRGANDAAIQQMNARGMGGGGAELASRLGGSAAYANANAMGDASISQAAQQRALQAIQGYGSLSSTMYGQEMARRQALDAYNTGNLDWRRGRETRNTGWANRQQDARTAARQQSYENQERSVHAAAGYNPHGAGAADRARQDKAADDVVSGIGGVLGSIF